MRVKQGKAGQSWTDEDPLMAVICTFISISLRRRRQLFRRVSAFLPVRNPLLMK